MRPLGSTAKRSCPFAVIILTGVIVGEINWLVTRFNRFESISAMKTITALLAALAATTFAFAQGTLNFANGNPTLISAGHLHLDLN